jgi:hypothetical protein
MLDKAPIDGGLEFGARLVVDSHKSSFRTVRSAD